MFEVKVDDLSQRMYLRIPEALDELVEALLELVIFNPVSESHSSRHPWNTYRR